MKSLGASLALGRLRRRIEDYYRYCGLPEACLVVFAVFICLILASCDTEPATITVLPGASTNGQTFQESVPVSNCNSASKTEIEVKRSVVPNLRILIAPGAHVSLNELDDKVLSTYRMSQSGYTVTLAVGGEVPAGSFYEYVIEWTEIIGNGQIEVGEIDNKPEATYTLVESMIGRIAERRQIPCSAIATATLTTTAAVTPVTPTAVPTATASTTVTHSIGRLEVTLPVEMVVGEADIVTVEIMAAPKFTTVGAYMPYATGVITIETKSGGHVRDRSEQEIKLYPVMSAELKAIGFEVEPNGDNRRVISERQPAAWTWNLIPKNPGRQTITVDIYGEMNLKDEKFVVLEKSKSWDIGVLERPLLKRLGDKIIDNLVAILGTGGPLALLILWLTYKSNKASKDLEKRVDALEERIPKRKPRKTDASEKTD